MTEFNFELFMNENGFDQLDSMPPEEQSVILASKFNCFSKKTSENILITCWIYNEATQRNSISNTFHKDTGIDPVKHESQIKKYRVIGKHFHKLMDIVDFLPNHWSTIYKISTLDDDDIQLLINAGVLHKNATCESIFGKNKKNTITTKLPSVIVEIKINKSISQHVFLEISKTLSSWNKKGFIAFAGDISFDYEEENETGEFTEDVAIKPLAALINYNPEVKNLV